MDNPQSQATQGTKYKDNKKGEKSKTKTKIKTKKQNKKQLKSKKILFTI